MLQPVNTKWLPHLTKEVVSEIENNYLDAYVVALEGWRRGLTLKWHVKDSEKFKDMKTWYVDNPGQLFSLHSKERSHYFFRTRGDKVTNEAVEIGMDKEKTKEKLKEKGLPTPEGRGFGPEEGTEEIVAYVKQLGFPVVIKPIDGSFGRGVWTNIKTEEECRRVIAELRQKIGTEKLLVEKYVDGKDYRLYVVENEVVGAILRVPPNVTGDGRQTIEELIARKNEERSLNPRLSTTLIPVDEELVSYLSSHGYHLTSVPAEGEIVYLSDKGNISLGGEPVDVLDDLSEEVKRLAVDALQAVPGLLHGAVDLMVETDSSGKEQAFVIELNPTAQLGGLLFPMRGKPRDIPKAIIDYYFPETKDIETDREKIYFDYYDVLEPLNSRQGHISTVSPAPVGTIHMKRYIVYGDVLNHGYHLGLRKQAFERGLHGFVSILDEDSIEIVVAGQNPEMLDDFVHGITEDEERATVTEIKEEPYDGFVKVGFDSRANFRTLEHEMHSLREELKELNEEIKALEIKRRKYHRSMSWKLTAPIRFFGAIVKGKNY